MRQARGNFDNFRVYVVAAVAYLGIVLFGYVQYYTPLCADVGVRTDTIQVSVSSVLRLYSGPSTPLPTPSPAEF